MAAGPASAQGGDESAATPTAGAAGVADGARRGVAAVLRIRRTSQQVILLGRKENLVLYSYPGAGRTVAGIDPETVASARMRLDYDRGALNAAVRQQDWGQAGAILYRGVYPVLPFLDLQKNNVIRRTMTAGTYLMRAAAVKSGCGMTAAGRAAAKQEYLAAYTVFNAASRAEWTSLSEEARLRAVICLVMLEQKDDALARIDEITVPDTNDDTYGLYRLAAAHAYVAAGQFRNGMEEVAQSIAFETKDINTFPDALLVSARCYEELQEWHRARDVYYEVACLFERTHWSGFALARLKAIMAEGHTADKESANVKNAFFGLDEDVNAKVAALLGLEEGAAADDRGQQEARPE